MQSFDVFASPPTVTVAKKEQGKASVRCRGRGVEKKAMGNAVI